jgi:hypothetical protein
MQHRARLLLVGLGLIVFAALGYARRRLHKPCAYTGRALDRQTASGPLSRLIHVPGTVWHSLTKLQALFGTTAQNLIPEEPSYDIFVIGDAAPSSERGVY